MRSAWARWRGLATCFVLAVSLTRSPCTPPHTRPWIRSPFSHSPPLVESFLEIRDTSESFLEVGGPAEAPKEEKAAPKEEKAAEASSSSSGSGSGSGSTEVKPEVDLNAPTSKDEVEEKPAPKEGNNESTSNAALAFAFAICSEQLSFVVFEWLTIHACIIAAFLLAMAAGPAPRNPDMDKPRPYFIDPRKPAATAGCGKPTCLKVDVFCANKKKSACQKKGECCWKARKEMKYLRANENSNYKVCTLPKRCARSASRLNMQCSPQTETKSQGL